MHDNDELVHEFAAESVDHLERAEACLLGMAGGSRDAELVQACFRALHTIKGLAGFLQLTRVQALAHSAEQVLDQLRSGTLSCTSACSDALLAATTRLGELIVAAREHTTIAGDESAWMQALDALLDGGGGYAPASVMPSNGDTNGIDAVGVSAPSQTDSQTDSQTEIHQALGELSLLDQGDLPGLILALARLDASCQGTSAAARELIGTLHARCSAIDLASPLEPQIASIVSAASRGRADVGHVFVGTR
jgi:chemotaxis protein histidine kinase CheA